MLQTAMPQFRHSGPCPVRTERLQWVKSAALVAAHRQAVVLMMQLDLSTRSSFRGAAQQSVLRHFMSLGVFDLGFPDEQAMDAGDCKPPHGIFLWSERGAGLGRVSAGTLWWRTMASRSATRPARRAPPSLRCRREGTPPAAASPSPPAASTPAAWSCSGARVPSFGCSLCASRAVATFEAPPEIRGQKRPSLGSFAAAQSAFGPAPCYQ